VKFIVADAVTNDEYLAPRWVVFLLDEDTIETLRRRMEITIPEDKPEYISWLWSISVVDESDFVEDDVTWDKTRTLGIIELEDWPDNNEFKTECDWLRVHPRNKTFSVGAYFDDVNSEVYTYNFSIKDVKATLNNYERGHVSI